MWGVGRWGEAINRRIRCPSVSGPGLWDREKPALSRAVGRPCLLIPGESWASGARPQVLPDTWVWSLCRQTWFFFPGAGRELEII